MPTTSLQAQENALSPRLVRDSTMASQHPREPKPPVDHATSPPQPQSQAPSGPTSNPHPTPVSASAIAYSPEKPDFLAPRTEFLLDWSLKILGLASAILFGIWAPISYKATADGNISNDASQTTLANHLSAMSAQASSAADVQSSVWALQYSAASAIASVERKVDAMGVLRAFEFCDGRANSISACAELSSSVQVGDVVGAFVTWTSPTQPPVSGAPTSSSGPNSTPSPTADNSAGSLGSGIKVETAVALGVTFGVIVIAGLIALLVAWKRGREERRKRSEEY